MPSINALELLDVSGNKTLDAALDEWCVSKKIPGLALSVRQHGEPLFEKYYGYRDVESELPVTSATMFGAASITKTFTAFAVMQLVDAKQLSLSDPMSKWLPEVQFLDLDPHAPIRISHLLSHTSGLPGLEAVNLARVSSLRADPDAQYLFEGFDLVENGPEVETVLDLMRVMSEIDFSLLGSPGSTFNYSNEGFALLQLIIERASGEDYISYMTDNILQPLDMDRSVFTMDELRRFDGVTELYAQREGENAVVFQSPSWWDVSRIYSTGALKTCNTDLLKFLDVFRLNGFVNGKQVISKVSLQTMASVHTTMPTGEKYGLALEINRGSREGSFGHPGSVKGVSSYFGGVESHGITLSILTNLAGVPVYECVSTVLQHFLGPPERKEDVMEDASRQPTSLTDYTGIYRSDEGKRVAITSIDGDLYMESARGKSYLKLNHKNQFQTQNGEIVVFLSDAYSGGAGLFLHKRFVPRLSEDTLPAVRDSK